MLHDILFWKVVMLTILLKGLEIERSYVSKWVSCSEALAFAQHFSSMWIFIWFLCQFYGQTTRGVTQEPSETGALCFPGKLSAFWGVLRCQRSVFCTLKMKINEFYDVRGFVVFWHKEYLVKPPVALRTSFHSTTFMVLKWAKTLKSRRY